MKVIAVMEEEEEEDGVLVTVPGGIHTNRAGPPHRPAGGVPRIRLQQSSSPQCSTRHEQGELLVQQPSPTALHLSLSLSLSHVHSDLNHELTIKQVVFTVFTPSLMFASLAETVTLKEITSW
ncbi:hypothetical protein BHM03_00031634 [Ensete ventricosum]|nr:hypothetical protein BHM03_00031634 [Ensete ventricosum]